MSLDQQILNNDQPINNSYSAENLKDADDKAKGAHFPPTSDDHESYNKNDNDDKSFGMKLGQIQNKSISLMKEIICLEPTVKEISLLQEIPDEDEEQCPSPINDNTNNNNNDNLETEQLFGRLVELDEELTNGIVYQPLLTGVINQSDDLSELKHKLRIIADLCIDYLWIDETAYVNELIETVNYYLGSNANNNNSNNNNLSTESTSNISLNKSYNQSLKRTGFWRQNPQEDIEKIYNEMGEDFKENFDKELENLNNRRTEALSKLNQEYIDESTKLDENYQNPSFLALLPFSKPSKELLDLRYKAKKLLKQNRIKEATELANKIKIKERAEEVENSKKVREKYYNDDRRLKEQYAIKRHNLELNFDMELSRLNCRKQKKAQMYENYISKLRRQIDHDSEFLSQNQNEKNNTESNNTSSTRRIKPTNFTTKHNINNSSFLQFGQFETKAPKMLDRSNDLLILDKMTEELLEKKASSPRRTNINKIFREQKKKK